MCSSGVPLSAGHTADDERIHTPRHANSSGTMHQIYVKTPNPKCRLFLKIDPVKALGGTVVYLHMTPYSTPPYTLYTCVQSPNL